MLVKLAENDARAPAAGAAKWAARLRRLRSGSGGGGGGNSSPVFVDVLWGCGHAEGLRNAEDIDMNAREAAFLVDATEKWERRERRRENT